LHIFILAKSMGKERQNKPQNERHLYIVHPTLDVLLTSCDNVKQVAFECGMDHSNFIKICKLGTDFRISTYVKCANAFGMETLIMHIPKEILDAIVDVKEHWSSRCHVIKEKDLLEILQRINHFNTENLPIHVELFMHRIKQEMGKSDLDKICDSLIELLCKLKEHYGNV
jgi:hypothetical protein